MFVLIRRTDRKSKISYTLIYPASIVSLDYLKSLTEDEAFITDIEYSNNEG